MPDDLLQLIGKTKLGAAEVAGRTRTIYETVLRTSRYLTAGNFTRFHPEDLRLLFDEYDRLFFAGRCRAALGDCPLRFRISRRMTTSGGKTTRFSPRSGAGRPSYEIAVSSTLLFQTFAGDDHRPISVAGLVCRDRLEALQRVFEHELVHLIETLLWTTSSCAARRFQSIASRLFSHAEHTHQLVTPQERAFVKFRVHPGSRVRFHLDGHVHQGVVNRITKRATVLVPDERGRLYSDGRRYRTFYVPLGMLEVIEGRR